MPEIITDATLGAIKEAIAAYRLNNVEEPDLIVMSTRDFEGLKEIFLSMDTYESQGLLEKRLYGLAVLLVDAVRPGIAIIYAASREARE